MRELLSPYNDRELSRRELTEVEDHLRTCKDCAFQSTMITNLKHALGYWEGVAPSERFHEKVMESVRTSPTPRRFFLPWKETLGALAAALGAGCVALVIWLAGSALKRPAPLPTPEPEPEVRARKLVVEPRPGPKAPRPAAPTPVAQIVLSKGTVHLRRREGKPAAAGKDELASAGDPVRDGDRLRVSPEGEAGLALADGAGLKLEDGGSLSFGSSGRELELSGGRLLLKSPREDWDILLRVRVRREIAELRCIEGPVLIHVQTRGPGAALQVAVASGEVEVRAGGAAVRLSQGQAVRLTGADMKLSEPSAAPRDALDALKRWGG